MGLYARVQCCCVELVAWRCYDDVWGTVPGTREARRWKHCGLGFQLVWHIHIWCNIQDSTECKSLDFQSIREAYVQLWASYDWYDDTHLTYNVVNSKVYMERLVCAPALQGCIIFILQKFTIPIRRSRINWNLKLIHSLAEDADSSGVKLVSRKKIKEVWKVISLERDSLAI